MYLLDTNVLIEAKNRYYSFDIAPGFWVWLNHAHDNALACSIEAVRDELLAGEDELAEWTRRHSGFFRAIDQGTTRHFAPLTAWAESGSFTQAARPPVTYGVTRSERRRPVHHQRHLSVQQTLGAASDRDSAKWVHRRCGVVTNTQPRRLGSRDSRHLYDQPETP